MWGSPFAGAGVRLALLVEFAPLSPFSSWAVGSGQSAFVPSLLDLLRPQAVLWGEGELSQPRVEGCAHEAVWCRVGNSPPSLFGKMAKLLNL